MEKSKKSVLTSSDVANYNDALYNMKASSLSQTHAIRQRDQGSTIGMKEFHNAIKRALILQFCSPDSRLYDIGCGRGGDIPKWIEADLRLVKGIDTSPYSIQECKERFWNITRKHPTNVQTTFQVLKTFGEQPSVEEPNSFDCVTSMFSLHYFFESEQKAKTLFSNVHHLLRPGGIFFGCFPDGKRILAALDDKDAFHSLHLDIHRRFIGPPQCFGSAYEFSMQDTVTSSQPLDSTTGSRTTMTTQENADTKSHGGSVEFLVFFNVVQTLANEFGLEPILDYGTYRAISHKPHLARFQTWSDVFDTQEKQQHLFKHFSPHLLHLTPELDMSSRLFCAFAFRKKDDVTKK